MLGLIDSNLDLLGHHAVSFVGYNDRGFILKNSWGKDYGNNGFTVLPYDHFNYIKQLWTIIK